MVNVWFSDWSDNVWQEVLVWFVELWRVGGADPRGQLTRDVTLIDGRWEFGLNPK